MGAAPLPNLYVELGAYLSQNPHFSESLHLRFTQWDSSDPGVNKHGIAWHEKTLGELFCDGISAEEISMPVDECEKGRCGVQLRSEVLKRGGRMIQASRLN
ncbi:hypothetical protein ACLK1Z_19935 [Escherichia coli]